MNEIIEVVSAQVHADWRKGKEADGFFSRKSETGEELMVQYSDLSEEAKELDRRTVRTVFAALPTLGLSIVDTRHLGVVRIA